MIIFLVTFNILAYIFLFCVWLWKRNKKSQIFTPVPTGYEDGRLYYGEDCGLRLPLEVSIDGEIEKVYYARRASHVTKVVRYSKFSLEVEVVKYDGYEVLDIYHTHIVPQVVRCKLIGGSVSKVDGGYKYLPPTRNGRARYVYLFGVRGELIDGDELVFSVYDRIKLVCCDEENGYKKDNAYGRELKVVPPCVVKTPDLRLNEYLNVWTWEELSSVDKNCDFDTAVVACAVKMCYTREGVGEFLKFHLMDAHTDMTKRCLLVRMLCEYMSMDGVGILKEKIGSFTLFDYVVGMINRASVRVKDEGIKTVRLFVVAVLEFIKFVEAGDLKLKLYGVMDKLVKECGVKAIEQLSDNYLLTYFLNDERVEVKSTVQLMYGIARGSITEIDLKRPNPLWLQKPTVTISAMGAGLLWRVVVHDVIGMRKVGDNLTFKPKFPQSWEKVDLDCLTGTGVYKVEFKSATSDLIKVDGVSFTGGVIPRGLGKGGKIEVYFSK